MKKALLFVTCFFLALLAAEGAVLVFPGLLGTSIGDLVSFRDFATGHLGKFEPRPHTVFARRPSEMFSNALGFTDKEWSLEKTPGVLRIACIGGSTTEGGNSHGRLGAFPHLLDEILEHETGGSVEVLNAGLSGWTSAEGVVSWFLTVKDFEPDLIVLHFAVNDVEPRKHPGYRADYTHWRHHWVEPELGSLDRFLIGKSDLYASLRLGITVPNIGEFTTYTSSERDVVGPGGVLDPATAGAYRRNLLSIGRDAARGGADVLLMTLPCRPLAEGEPNGNAYRAGVDEHNGIMHSLAREEGWMLADAATVFMGGLEGFEDPSAGMDLGSGLLDARPKRGREAFIDLVHLDPAGNLEKAKAIARVLMEEWAPLSAMLEPGR